MPRKKRTKRQAFVQWFRSKSRLHQVVFLLVVAAIGGVGSYLVVRSFATPPEVAIRRFEERPSRGMYWGGLRENPGGRCAHLLEAVDDQGNFQGCSHGPDPAPDHLDPKRDVPPAAEDEEIVDTENAPAEPEVSASVTSTGYAEYSSGYVNCIEDGVSGPRYQVLYVRASDRTDRYNTYLPSFRKWASGIDNIFMLSAKQTGGYRAVRWVHDSSCRVTVPKVTVSSSADDNWGNLTSALKAQGYNRSDRKYLVWTDANVYCGMGDYYNDDRPGQENYNNGGPLYARVDAGCWGAGAASHEMMHNLGSIQRSAPHFNGHCYDGYDAMCYTDGGVSLRVICSDTAHKHRYDCRKDDYFHTNPPSTNYLYTHWNTANNKFLTRTAFDATPPTVTISAPRDGSTIGSSTLISASATDNFRIYKMKLWIDGVRRVDTTASSFSYTWNSSAAAAGKHTLTVKAYDLYGNTRNLSYYVYR
jgi:hypothetical protein